MFQTRIRSTIHSWPGVVDILVTLLIMSAFVATIFVVSQHYLGGGRVARQLQSDVQALNEVLLQEHAGAAQFASDLDRLQAELALVEERDRAEEQRAALAGRVRVLERQLEQAQKQLADRRAQAVELESRYAQQGQPQVGGGNRAGSVEPDTAARDRELAGLREQLAKLEGSLAAAETTIARQRAELEELHRQLDAATAGQTEELQHYRSEFFGRLRVVLGERPDIRIVGDRFVLQAELLFESGSAEIGLDGRQQLMRIAETLQALARQMPQDIDWVLQVDGHTDVRPISTQAFPSNWELSAARATSIVHFLVERGIPPERLAAAGFGEFQPVDGRHTEEAYRRNRRIEFKFTSR